MPRHRKGSVYREPRMSVFEVMPPVTEAVLEIPLSQCVPPWHIGEPRLACWSVMEPHAHGSETRTGNDRWHEGYQQKMTEWIRNGGVPEQLDAEYCRKCKRYFFADGGHRLEAYRRLGRGTIIAKVEIFDHPGECPTSTTLK